MLYNFQTLIDRLVFGLCTTVFASVCVVLMLMVGCAMIDICERIRKWWMK